MGYQPQYKYAPVDSQTGRVRFTSYIEKGPLIVFDSLVFQAAFSKENGIKRYKNYQYAQNSDFGKVLEKEIDKYLRKSIDTLYIDRAFWRAYKGY